VKRYDHSTERTTEAFSTRWHQGTCRLSSASSSPFGKVLIKLHKKVHSFSKYKDWAEVYTPESRDREKPTDRFEDTKARRADKAANGIEVAISKTPCIAKFHQKRQAHGLCEPRLQRRHQYHKICGAEDETRGAYTTQICRAVCHGRSAQREAEARSRGGADKRPEASAHGYSLPLHGRGMFLLHWASVCVPYALALGAKFIEH